jgi:deferrochelatase/peroxidase EfeB
MAEAPRGITRRRLVATAGGAALTLAAGAGGFELGRRTDDEAEAGPGSATIPFYGARQAGIATPAQDRLVFAAFDLTLQHRAELHELMRVWTDAAARMTQGETIGPVEGPLLAPPLDTGEAFGLGPARLTVTFGFGPTVFLQDGQDRFGLASRRPALLRPLGPLPGELLDPESSDGDLCVQACADDPQVAFHAVRNLARLGRGACRLRWLQLGFGRTSATTTAQTTPRNLMGFKDGTNNVKAEDTEAMENHVWVGKGEPQAWMRGGSYLVCRRIRMLIETWDRSSLDDQQLTMGRFKETGAPLNGTREHDTVDLSTRGGSPPIPLDAHIRLAAPASNDGQSILRRGYSFTDGIDPENGELNAGLFFICFQRDPHRQFAAIQRRLGSEDALTEYIQHTASGLFAVPPGARRGGPVAEPLLA